MMLKKIVLSTCAVSFVLALAACSGQSADPDRPGGKADDTGDTRSPMSELATLLSEPHAVQMPAIGEEHGAGDIDVSAEAVQATSLGAILDGNALLAEYAGYYDDYAGDTEMDPLYVLASVPDAYLRVESGYLSDIRDEFLTDVVADDQRTQATELLSELPYAKYTRIQFYDVGAEIWGFDMIVIFDDEYGELSDGFLLAIEYWYG